MEQWRERWRVRVIQFRRHYIPHLVWHGDEVDVLVTFKEDRLRAATPQEAMTDFNRGSLHEARLILNEIGVEFDTGLGIEGRDWEWDWSLRGPISVSFKRRAQNPELRQ
jgi:hypothetical protein